METETVIAQAAISLGSGVLGAFLGAHFATQREKQAELRVVLAAASKNLTEAGHRLKALDGCATMHGCDWPGLARAELEPARQAGVEIERARGVLEPVAGPDSELYTLYAGAVDAYWSSYAGFRFVAETKPEHQHVHGMKDFASEAHGSLKPFEDSRAAFARRAHAAR